MVQKWSLQKCEWIQINPVWSTLSRFFKHEKKFSNHIRAEKVSTFIGPWKEESGVFNFPAQFGFPSSFRDSTPSQFPAPLIWCSQSGPVVSLMCFWVGWRGPVSCFVIKIDFSTTYFPYSQCCKEQCINYNFDIKRTIGVF